MITLAVAVSEYKEPIEYDLMCTLHMRLRDVPVTIGWSGLGILLRNLPETSAFWRARNPDYAPYTTAFRTNLLLADVFDAVQCGNYLYATAHGGNAANKPKPAYRPWVAEDGAHIGGEGAVPADQFEQAYYDMEVT